MKKTIGIIGGMGPEGTADLYMKIIKYYQINFGAKYDKDFPEIFINSIPIPDVVESLENEKITLSMLITATKKLQNVGCNFIVIACNTIQFLLKLLQREVKIPILGIATTTAQYLMNKNICKIGILATSTTITKQVYNQELREKGITLIKPDNQEQLMLTEVIMNQLAGKTSRLDKGKLIKIIVSMKKRGAEAVLIACTDLPMIVNQINTDIKLIDCTQIYADEAARFANSS